MAKKTEKQATTNSHESQPIEVQAEQEKAFIKSQIKAQKEFFKTGTTRPIEWRLKQLKSLYSSIKQHESEIYAALNTDLAKSEFEAYVSEIGLVLHEITLARKNLRKWAKPKKSPKDISIKPARGKTVPNPMGTVLIISPWNYPFLLSLQPLVSAIASGNTVVLKVSESAPATGKIIESILQEVFPPEYIYFIQPGFLQKQILLHEQFDFIFFTGSPKVGKLVMESAAKFLTPVCLELGGKSPCIVDETANITLAARRIVWGKFLNAGQTCVAPDYILVNETIKDSLIKSLYDEIEVQYGENPLENEKYPKIINTKHFSRLYSMVPDAKVDTRTNKIAPSIISLGSVETDQARNHPTMKEEIFGPILPIITYSSIGDAINFITEKPSPLALYLFSKNKATQRVVFNSIRFGGGCLNDVVCHLIAKGLPFGGVGESGMGNYHGEYGFKTFSHYKALLIQSPSKDNKYRYNTKNNKLNLVKKLLR